MLHEKTLFDFPAYRTGHDTQAAAALSVREHAGGMREKVWQFIAARGSEGATNEEIANGLGMKIQTVCGRVNELQGISEKGLPRRIVDSGARRKTSSGCSAKVWVAAN